MYGVDGGSVWEFFENGGHPGGGSNFICDHVEEDLVVLLVLFLQELVEGLIGLDLCLCLALKDKKQEYF